MRQRSSRAVMIVVLTLAIVLYLIVTTQPSARRLFARMGGGVPVKLAAVGLALAAIGVLLHGNLWAAACLLGAALWLLGRSGGTGAVRRTASSRARVPDRWRSPVVELRKREDGRLVGRVLAGPMRGADLETLGRGQLDELRRFCRGADPQGAGLLEAYLDGRFPGWREAAQADGHSGRGRSRRAAGMSEDEAYEVLGLRRGETLDDVKRAHRALMKRWHPDQGGTSDLAARANEAKEVLLRRHGGYS